MPIRLVIADDHVLFRQGLRRLLEAKHDMLVVAEAGTGEEAIAAVRASTPDIVLMDVDMPVVDGITATVHIVRAQPDIGIIVLTMHLEEDYFLRAVRAGARGYLLKNTPVEELARAIRAVAAGRTQFDPDMTTHLVTDYQRVAATLERAHGDDLTDRQRAIVQLISTGASNKEIAEQLSYAEKTIKNELTDIYRKLEVRDRTQAAMEALRRGLITRPVADRDR